jgi:hypothetical protein
MNQAATGAITAGALSSTRHMDRSPELTNMLDVIYEIQDELGIAHVKHSL